MDKATILVGHALHHDLNVLKIAHDRCVDSEILAKAAINRPGQSSGTGLKKVCDSLMGLGVQRMANHSCLEDSFAAREAVIYMTSHPEELAVWAKAKQKVIDEEAAKRLAAKEAKEEVKKQSAIAEAKEKAAAADDKQVQKVLTMAMPALVPTPANEASEGSQVNRGPSAGKKRKARRAKNGLS
jgi:DNA polymerase III epsilon subunit-like protein